MFRWTGISNGVRSQNNSVQHIYNLKGVLLIIELNPKKDFTILHSSEKLIRALSKHFLLLGSQMLYAPVGSAETPPLLAVRWEGSGRDLEETHPPGL